MDDLENPTTTKLIKKIIKLKDLIEGIVKIDKIYFNEKILFLVDFI